MSYNAMLRAKQRRSSGIQNWNVGSSQTSSIGIPHNLVKKVSKETNTIVYIDGIKKDNKNLVVSQNTLSGVGRYRSQFYIDSDGAKYSRYYLDEEQELNNYFMKMYSHEDGIIILDNSYTSGEFSFRGYNASSQNIGTYFNFDSTGVVSNWTYQLDVYLHHDIGVNNYSGRVLHLYGVQNIFKYKMNFSLNIQKHYINNNKVFETSISPFSVKGIDTYCPLRWTSYYDNIRFINNGIEKIYIDMGKYYNYKNLSVISIPNFQISPWKLGSLDDTFIIDITNPILPDFIIFPNSLINITDWSYMFLNNMPNPVSTTTYTILTNNNINIKRYSDFSNWDPSMVTSMFRMFFDCNNFTGAGLENWNIGNVQSLNNVFQKCNYFNADIGLWNTSNVEYMAAIFEYANSFNQDISGWDVSKVIDMDAIFNGASSFNQDISRWNTSSAVSMNSTFLAAKVFNQDLSWNVSNVIDMKDMFNGASVFNGDISSWDVSNVTDMGNMFNGASSFNQDLSSWDVSNCTIYGMFLDSGLDNSNKNSIYTAWQALGFQPSDLNDAGLSTSIP
jgi:surface protein